MILFTFKMPVTKENVTQVSSDLAEATNMTGVNATGLEGIALTLESIIDVQSPTPEVSVYHRVEHYIIAMCIAVDRS